MSTKPINNSNSSLFLKIPLKLELCHPNFYDEVFKNALLLSENQSVTSMANPLSLKMYQNEAVVFFIRGDSQGIEEIGGFQMGTEDKLEKFLKKIEKKNNLSFFIIGVRNNSAKKASSMIEEKFTSKSIQLMKTDLLDKENIQGVQVGLTFLGKLYFNYIQ